MSLEEKKELYDIQAEIVQMQEKMAQLAKREKVLDTKVNIPAQVQSPSQPSLKFSRILEKEGFLSERRLQEVLNNTAERWTTDFQALKQQVEQKANEVELLKQNQERYEKDQLEVTESMRQRIYILEALLEAYSNGEGGTSNIREYQNRFESMKKLEKEIKQRMAQKQHNAASYANQRDPAEATRKQLSSNQNGNQNNTILLIGNSKDTKKPSMFILNKEKSEWEMLTIELPIGHPPSGAVYYNSEIYIFGGGGLAKATYKLDQNLKWSQLGNMKNVLTLINNSSLVYQQAIWVLGGQLLNLGPTNKVECYDASYLYKLTWQEKPPINEARQSAAATVYQEKLFVCGGWNSKYGRLPLRSVECYDDSSRKWTLFKDLPDPRTCHVMLSSGSSIFVIGGCDGDEECNTVWNMNLHEHNPTWKEDIPMKVARSSFTAICFETGLLTIGGALQRKTEFFNGQKWTAGPNLPDAYEAVSVMAISQVMTDSFVKNNI